ncbi:hypothetical protein DEO72_LG5g2914 [Vigna unguiculata]|uniref:Uncharacterized protein n=1 Tax=Vigna unguiculata TaxID=3917 RepID=A0A4D6M151_VIGUN|nr:hypothetical protein DEO72_LG5g2914 [Vigna unguiculata]
MFQLPYQQFSSPPLHCTSELPHPFEVHRAGTKSIVRFENPPARRSPPSLRRPPCLRSPPSLRGPPSVRSPPFWWSPSKIHSPETRKGYSSIWFKVRIMSEVSEGSDFSVDRKVEDNYYQWDESSVADIGEEKFSEIAQHKSGDIDEGNFVETSTDQHGKEEDGLHQDGKEIQQSNMYKETQSILDLDDC